MLSDFLQILKTVKDVEDVNKLIALKNQGVAYSPEMLDAITDHESPLKALSVLTKVFDPNNIDELRATAEDESALPRHLIQEMIDINWSHGVEYLLKKYPSLSNLAIIIDRRGRQGYEINSLLGYAWDQKVSPRMMKVLFLLSENIDLSCTNDENILHRITGSDNVIYEKYHSLLCNIWKNEKISSKILAMLEQPDPRGLTPICYANNNKNELFLNLAREKLEASGKQLRISMRDEPIVLSEKERTRLILNDLYAGVSPDITPGAMMFEILGKQYAKRSISENSPEKPRLKLFFNAYFMAEYLEYLLKNNQKQFFISGIILTYNAAHWISILISRNNNNSLNVEIIDPDDEESSMIDHEIKEELERVTQKFDLELSFKTFREHILNVAGFCRTSAIYWAGRFMAFSLNDLAKLPNEEYRSIKSFPLKSGILAACQSLSKINDSLEYVESDPEKRTKFLQKLSQRKGLEFDSRFIGVKNRAQNHMLQFKNIRKNRLKNALAGLEIQTLDPFDDLICITELKPELRGSLVKYIIEYDLSWWTLFRSKNYDELMDRTINSLLNRLVKIRDVRDLDKLQVPNWMSVEHWDKMLDVILESKKQPEIFKLLLKVYPPEEPNAIKSLDKKTLIYSCSLRRVIDGHWLVGLKTLLEMDPKLIDSPILESDSSEEYTSLLMHALSVASEHSTEVFDYLIEHTTHIDLTDSSHCTVLHHLARSKPLSDQFQKQAEALFKKSTEKMMKQKDYTGLTPLAIAKINQNDTFIRIANEYGFTQDENPVQKPLSSRINLNDKESSKQVVNFNFLPLIPDFTPAMMMLTLYGHSLNQNHHNVLLRLYFNVKFFANELNSLLAKGVKDFTIIGNLRPSGTHIVTFVMSHDSGEKLLKFRFFEADDSDEDFNLEGMNILRRVASSYGFHVVMMTTDDLEIENGEGYLGRSCYLTGHLLSLDPSVLKKITDSKKTSLSSLPLETGALAVCESLPKIDKLLTRIDASDAQKNTFRENLQKSIINKFDSRYTQVSNQKLNNTLSDEIRKQSEFATKGLETATYETLSTMIFLPARAAKLIEFIFAADFAWADLFGLRNYNDLLFLKDVLLNQYDLYLPFFIDAKVNLNYQNTDGKTLLMLAVINRKVELVKLLLKRNVNLTICDKNGTTALGFATNQSHTQLIELLQNANNVPKEGPMRFSVETKDGATSSAAQNDNKRIKLDA